MVFHREGSPLLTAESTDFTDVEGMAARRRKRRKFPGGIFHHERHEENLENEMRLLTTESDFFIDKGLQMSNGKM